MPIVILHYGDSDIKESICSAETWVLSLDQKDSLEMGMATNSNILSRRNQLDSAWWA